MITTNNGIELRNLEEQVLKNQQDIARHYEIDRVIADLGIRVLGEVPSYNDLLLITGDSYGDAYKVVSEGDYYVWTRSNPVLGIENPYWFNIGPLSIPGPQGPIGPQGETGPQGERGSVWTTSAYPPVITADTKTGDQHLDTSSGMVYQYDGTSYQAIQSIRGPQGIQGIRGPQGEQGPQGETGEKGDTGDVGAFIHIVGILSTTSELPTPAALNDLSAAYLIGNSKELYIQVGEDSASAQWQNMGTINVATYVTSGGQYQNVWDADTKLDKIVNTDGEYKDKVYIATGTGGQTTKLLRFDGSVGAVVSYVYPSASVPENPVGTFAVATPTQPGHPTNKTYVDTALEGKVDKITPIYDGKRVYAVGKVGDTINQTSIPIANSAHTVSNGNIPQYFTTTTTHGSTELPFPAVLLTSDPTQPYHTASKHYVDSKDTHLYRYNITIASEETSMYDYDPIKISLISTKSFTKPTSAEMPTLAANYFVSGYSEGQLGVPVIATQQGIYIGGTEFIWGQLYNQVDDPIIAFNKIEI